MCQKNMHISCAAWGYVVSTVEVTTPEGQDASVNTFQTGRPIFAAQRSPASGVTFDSDESENAIWRKLEELALTRSGSFTSNFQPSLQCFTNKTANSANPVAIVDGKWSVVAIIYGFESCLSVCLCLSPSFLPVCLIH